jgi:hypothetical protein
MKVSTETKPKSPIAEDLSQMVLAQSLPCVRCGYDLRNLQADGDCPECGEPIRLTIIETVDPATRRLSPIHDPKKIGNSLVGIVLFFFLSTLLAVIALLIDAPNSLPVPQIVRGFPSSVIVWGATCFSLIAFLMLTPLIQMCQRKELIGCRAGILLTGSGLLLWALSMLFVNMLLLNGVVNDSGFVILFDTCLPVISAGLIFSGFRKLIPRLGQRSRAFRQAQGSRQRMNDLLAALVVIIVGRLFLVISIPDSNMSFLGLIILVMSISLVVIGIGYLLRNTIWIRRALITPPPALTELLKVKPS